MYTQLEVESHLDGKLQIAFLNDEKTYNSLNKTLLSELRTFIHDGSRDENVRCLAISGRGKAFCSGQNLKDAMSFSDPDEESDPKDGHRFLQSFGERNCRCQKTSYFFGEWTCSWSRRNVSVNL